MSTIDGDSTSDGLSILIVGGGIGGLTAAIALQQQGHRVEVFERSRFANEIGAAIHLSPNANGVLKRLGVDAEQFGAVETEQIREFSVEGELQSCIPVIKDAPRWQHKWLLVHRAHLHENIKAAALAPGKGTPVKLHTSSAVADIDTQNATIRLEDRTTVRGDVVIGADGVNSMSRSKLPGRNVEPTSSGKNAFRFLITRQEALDDPLTADIAAADGSMDIWKGPDRRIIIYPCGGNKILNFACIHPDHLGRLGSSSGWNQEGAKESLLDTYKGFSPTALALLEKAEPQGLKIWPLLDMPTLPVWVKDNFALMGDAAHPFLPYRASGGAMAIEDAVSLAVMLSADAKREDIPERLQLYERARYQRVNKILDYTRLCGEQQQLPVEKEIEITNYIYGHDEFDSSTYALRKHLRSKSPQMYWRQPTAFGPLPGPRQDFFGCSHAPTLLESTFTTASFKFKTSRTLLQNLLPNDSYSFAKPDTVAYATFSQTTLDRMKWLGGNGYNHLGLYIHGVQYKKADGEVIQGTYLPILFENLADPILSGREELGMPKLYSAIDVDRRENSYQISCNWRGAIWARFSLHDLADQDSDAKADADAQDSDRDAGILTHRYIPAVGRDQKGKADADYAVFVPKDEEAAVVPPKLTRARKSANASIEIDGLDWDALPTLHHVISRLAEIPVYDIVEAKLVEGQGVSDVSSARRIA